MSDFELDHLLQFRIVIDGGLHFRHFLAIIPQKLPAHGGDVFREFLDAQSPHAEVGFVNTLVAYVAVAIIPMPVPIVVHEILGEGSHRCRTAPEIVVQSLGNGGYALVSDVSAAAEYKAP